MPKMKHCLSGKNSTCRSSLKATACSVFSRSKMLRHRKRKRKVGVTLIKAVKKSQPPSDLFLGEAATTAGPKQKRHTPVPTMHKNSNKDRLRSNVRDLPSTTYKTTDYCAPDVVAGPQNEEADSCAETTISSCVLPIVIDDSSDADCSSAADTTTMFNTSGVSDAFNSEEIDDIADCSGIITYGLGYQ